MATDVKPHLIGWFLLVIGGGIFIYLNGIDLTGATVVLAGMIGLAVTTIRDRWTGALSRLVTRIRTAILKTRGG